MDHIPFNPFIDMFLNEEVKELFTLERTILQTAWMLDTTQMLAELACAVAALAFYLSSNLNENAPFYLGHLHLFIYLGQGIFVIWKSERWVAGWSDRKRPWWRQIIAVLGWPMHRSLVNFHQKVHLFDERHPPQMMTIDWLRENMFFSLVYGLHIWLIGFAVAITVASLLGRVLGVY